MPEAIDETGCGTPENRARGPWMQTHGGRAFYLLDPRAEDVDIYDIAHALAVQNRFAGHTRKPYSVAQHSVMVSRIIPDQYAIYGLMHDAAEAYCQDLTRPLKLSLRELDRLNSHGSIERMVRLAIFRRFGLDETLFQAIEHVIKTADNIAVATEQRDLMARCDKDWAIDVPPLKTKISPWSWSSARARFLRRFNDLLPHGRSITPAPVGPVPPNPFRMPAFAEPAFIGAE